MALQCDEVKPLRLLKALPKQRRFQPLLSLHPQSGFTPASCCATAKWPPSRRQWAALPCRSASATNATTGTRWSDQTGLAPRTNPVTIVAPMPTQRCSLSRQATQGKRMNLIQGRANVTVQPPHLYDAGDVIVEDTNQGTDTVHSSITWTLSDDTLNLTLLPGSATTIICGNTGTGAGDVLDIGRER